MRLSNPCHDNNCSNKLILFALRDLRLDLLPDMLTNVNLFSPLYQPVNLAPPSVSGEFMVSLINQLTALFQSAMRQAYPALPAEITALVTPITKEQFGDYQFNSG